MVLFITNVLGREKAAVPVWGGGLQLTNTDAA